MSSPFADLDRPPLSARALTAALVVPGALWHRIEVLAQTESTNADVARAAVAGEPEGLVVVAEHQTGGRGRAGRTWSAPPRSGLTFSVLLRPPVGTRPQWGWLPLLAGVATATAVQRLGEIETRVKWPNDVLVGERKLAGILTEAHGDAVVVGVGLNVSLRADELPVPEATSLALAGAQVTDRDPVLRAVLRDLAQWYARWCDGRGDPDVSGLRGAYREICATLGREVTVHLPNTAAEHGCAVDVDAAGCLVVETEQGRQSFAAGDVVHVR